MHNQPQQTTHTTMSVVKNKSSPVPVTTTTKTKYNSTKGDDALSQDCAMAVTTQREFCNDISQEFEAKARERQATYAAEYAHLQTIKQKAHAFSIQVFETLKSIQDLQISILKTIESKHAALNVGSDHIVARDDRVKLTQELITKQDKLSKLRVEYTAANEAVLAQKKKCNTITHLHVADTLDHNAALYVAQAKIDHVLPLLSEADKGKLTACQQTTLKTFITGTDLDKMAKGLQILKTNNTKQKNEVASLYATITSLSAENQALEAKMVNRENAYNLERLDAQSGNKLVTKLGEKLSLLKRERKEQIDKVSSVLDRIREFELDWCAQNIAACKTQLNEVKRQALELAANF